MVNFSCKFRVQTGKFSLFIHSLYFWDQVQPFPIPKERVCLVGNTTVASRQHLADLLAATRNTSSLQVSATSHDGLYRWFLGVGGFFPTAFLSFMAKLSWMEDLHCSWKLVSLGLASSSVALMPPATEVKYSTPLRSHGVPSKHGHRGFGYTTVSFRASLNPLAQHHIMYTCLQPKIY